MQESADEIELEDGEFEIDSDFYSLDNNVYLALYDTGGNFLYGKVPPGLEQAPQFEDGKIQTVKSGTEQWYVYDVQYEMENGQEFYIRGVVSVTETQKEFLYRSPICGDFTAFDCDFNGADRVSFDQANASSGTADDRDRTGDSKRRRFKSAGSESVRIPGKTNFISWQEHLTVCWKVWNRRFSGNGSLLSDVSLLSCEHRSV